MNCLPIGIISDQRLVRKALFCLLSTLPIGRPILLAVDADSIEDASGQIADSKPHVLLIDSDGAGDPLECVRRVSSLSPSTKSLLLAGQIEETFAIEAVQSGAWGIVGKQAEPALLQQAIQKLMNGEVWFSHRTIGAALHTLTNNENPAGSPLDRLTPRETEVLMLLSEGLCNKQIASRLFLSESTIKVYVKGIYRKLGVNSRLKAALSYTDHIERANPLTSLHTTTLVETGENPVSYSCPQDSRSRRADKVA